MAFNYSKLVQQSLDDQELSPSTAVQILEDSSVELLPLLTAAYEVRKKFCGKSVTIHIINNAQNGFCPEDCHYCAQAKSSKANIKEYPLKSEDEILKEAERAYKSGAYRYCMVFAGRGPSQRRVNDLARVIKEIKSRYPIEICVSAGLLDEEKASVLKDAGLDRLNHNLNTSQKHYPNICSTHTYNDRWETLTAARKAGLQLCSGIIVGMGESDRDVIDVAYQLRKLKAESIPVNFLIPVQGTLLATPPQITPEYCLKVLSLYRFLNPKSEIRIAAGREYHLRNMEVLALYPANSLFMDGYLNAKGGERAKTLQMIKDAGFTIDADFDVDQLLAQEYNKAEHIPEIGMKNFQELRPFISP
jgi:biotin synthase